MLRGNGGAPIFFDDDDRCRLYLLLQEGVERFGHQILAFCLMNNHLHLAVQVDAVPLSKSMQNLAFRYTRWINKRAMRTGHLFQGRYKAILVDADSYLLELVRYIHLNPLRAGLVSDPADYLWTGHRAYLGMETLPWLTSDWVLGLFAKRLATARKRYAAFVSDGREEGYREEFHGGGTRDTRLLGSDRFVDRALGGQHQARKDTPPLGTIIRQVAKFYGLKEFELVATGHRRDASEARAVIGYIATQLGSEMLTTVAGRFGRDVATFSTALSRLNRKMRSGSLSQPARRALTAANIKI